MSLKAKLALVLLATFAVHAPALENEFALDDGLIARATLPDGTPNRMVAELRPLGDYFRATYWEGDHGRESRLYRPVTVLGFALTNQLAGEGPAMFWHHLINVLLGVWATALVFSMVLGLVPGPGAALAAAAVFGLHAIHSEVVASIFGRAELLAFCFGAQALLLYRPGARLWRDACVALLLFCAFGSKESGLAWVFFLPLWHHLRGVLPGGVLRRGHAARMVAMVGLPALGFLVLRTLAVAGTEESANVTYIANPLFFAAGTTRICTALWLWVVGLARTLLPLGLVSDHGPVTFDLIQGPLDPRVLLAVVLLCGMVFFGLRASKRHPALFFAMVTFLGFGFLTSNLPFAIGTIFGERLYYAPSLGLSFAVAWLWTRLPRGLEPVGLVGLGAWLLLSVISLSGRIPVWHDDDSLFLHDARINPRSLRLLDAAAGIHARRGEVEEAERLWHRAVSLDPAFATGFARHGTFLARRHVLDRAEDMYRRALDCPAVRRDHDWITRVDLGNVLLERGLPGPALHQLRRALEERPGYPDLYAPLFEAADKLGRAREAIATWQRLAADERIRAPIRAAARRKLQALR